MRYLAVAFYGEGETDYRFFPPLLRRVLLQLLTSAVDEVEVGEQIIELRSASRDGDAVYAAAYEARDSYHLLIRHCDGAGNPDRARSTIISPLATALDAALQERSTRVVGVVPVRETEAWALVDGDALRRAFGTNLDDEQLGVPRRPRDVEGIQDPKAALKNAWAAVVGVARARQRPASEYLPAIAEGVCLDRLSNVPSYRRFVDDLRAHFTITRLLA